MGILFCLSKGEGAEYESTEGGTDFLFLIFYFLFIKKTVFSVCSEDLLYSVSEKMGKWGNGEMGKWENGKMGKWENGKIYKQSKIKNKKSKIYPLPSTLYPHHPVANKFLAAFSLHFWYLE